MNENQLEIVKKIFKGFEKKQIQVNYTEHIKELLSVSKELSLMTDIYKAETFYVETAKASQDGYFIFLSYGNNRMYKIIYGVTPNSEFTILKHSYNYGGINGYEMKAGLDDVFMSYIEHYGWGSSEIKFLDRYGKEIKKIPQKNLGSCYN
ncbi:MAG: hypothetical protein K0R54_1825 [Clostridiaceae bacterium]|jgi:hypothetical protein|nr:hypothetical protein [Clostridiaceae bacterium]